MASTRLSLVLAVVISIGLLAQTGLGQFQLPPLPPLLNIPGLLPPGIRIPGLIPFQSGSGNGALGQQCWTALASVPGCALEIFTSIFGGRIGSLGPACCSAIINIGDNCWPKLFPFNPILPPLLKNSCSNNNSSVKLNGSALTLPGLLPPVSGIEIEKCWSSLANVEGCVVNLYKSLLSGQVLHIDADCCKAVAAVEENCWPKLFPLNPAFPPFLKGSCGAANPPE